MKRPLFLLLAPLAAIPMLFGEENGTAPAPAPALPAQTAPGSPASTDKPLSLMPTLPSQQDTPKTTEEVPLIPPLTLPGEEPKKKKKQPVGPSKTDAAEDALQLHIKLRAAKTLALEDPLVQQELAKANVPKKTDYDQREGFKRYYVLLYARMLKIDPTITAGLSTRQAVSMWHEYQWRVTPTVPRDQIGMAPVGPENYVIPGSLANGTPPPRRFFGAAKIGASN